MKSNKFIVLLLVFSLVITLLPIQEASAAQITLSSNYATADTADNAVEVFSPTMNLSGIVTGATPADVRYTVTQVSTATENAPDLAPSTIGNDFTFQGVQLFVGLNKITLKVPGTETQFYVYYIDSPNISNLELLDPNLGYQLFKQYDRSIPANPSFRDPFIGLGADDAAVKNFFDNVMRTSPNNVNIRGAINNVQRVYINGEEILSSPTNIFNHNLSQNDIYKGDHTINITGENVDGSTFTFPFSFAVFNEQPTFFNNAVVDGAGTKFLDPAKETIVNLPSGDITFAGHLYIPSGQEDFTEIELIVKENGVSDRIHTLTKTDLESDALIDSTLKKTFSNYTIYRVEEALNLTPALSISNLNNYTLEVKVKYDLNGNPQSYRSQEFEIKYIDTNQPYILDVVNNNTGISLITNPIIMSTSDSLRINVNDKTNSVSVNGGGLINQLLTSRQSSNGNYYFSVPLTDIQRGNHTLTFTPYSTSDGSGTAGDVLNIPVNVTLTPTVKLTDIANNQVFQYVPSQAIGVEYVNLPDVNDRAQTQVNLNGAPISNNAISADASPVLEQNKFEIDLSHNDVTLREGGNELEIVVTSSSGGQTTTTVVKVTFLFLPVNTPQIGVLEPKHISDDSNLEAFMVIPGQPSSYVTMEKHVRLRFTLTNDKAQVVYLQKNGQNIARLEKNGSNWDFVSEGDPTVTDFINVTTTGTAPNETLTFETDKEEDLVPSTLEIGGRLSLLSKDDQGKTIFNTTTTYTINAYANYNSGTNTATPPLGTRTIVIQRQPAMYEFTPGSEADIVMNKDSGVINKNFFPFDIVTEPADSVIVNKLEATKDPNYNDDQQGRVRFHVDVPLKTGSNKITVVITRGEQEIKQTFEVFYTDTIIPGSGFRETLGKSTRFRVFDRNVELQFPKGTILTAPHSEKQFNKLLNEIPVMFGMADPTYGIISEVEKNHTSRNLLADTLRAPNNFDFVGPIYWIDAGTIDNPGGLTPLDKKINSQGYDETILNRALNFNVKDNLKPTQRGELTISFNEEIRTEMNRRISVMYHNGIEWKNIGGVLDSKKNTVTVPFDAFGYYAVMRQRESYRDIVEHPWAKLELELLSTRNWMQPSGYGSNFGAYDTANRGEFATMLVKIFNIPLDYEGRSSFADVPNNFKTPRYEHKYIETAARVGIVQGKSVGFFDPEGTLTREHAAVMIARAANYRLQEYEKVQTRLEKMFVDADQVNRYAAPSVQAVTKSKIIEGIPVLNAGGDAGRRQEVRFNPQGFLTRDQLAVLTVRLLRSQKLIE